MGVGDDRRRLEEDALEAIRVLALVGRRSTNHGARSAGRLYSR